MLLSQFMCKRCHTINVAQTVQQCEDENQTDGSFVYLECFRVIDNSSAHLALPVHYFPLQVAEMDLSWL